MHDFFVNHFPKIVDLETQSPGSVGAYHFSYLLSNKDPSTNISNDQRVDNMNYKHVLYFFKLVPGVSKSSSGFKVAQLAQRIYGSEICNEGYLTAKADVYSFSIVPLETVSRKSNTNFIPKEEFVSLIDQESSSGPKSGEVDESSDSWRLQAWSS